MNWTYLIWLLLAIFLIALGCLTVVVGYFGYLYLKKPRTTELRGEDVRAAGDRAARGGRNWRQTATSRTGAAILVVAAGIVLMVGAAMTTTGTWGARNWFYVACAWAMVKGVVALYRSSLGTAAETIGKVNNAVAGAVLIGFYAWAWTNGNAPRVEILGSSLPVSTYLKPASSLVTRHASVGTDWSPAFTWESAENSTITGKVLCYWPSDQVDLDQNRPGNTTMFRLRSMTGGVVRVAYRIKDWEGSCGAEPPTP